MWWSNSESLRCFWLILYQSLHPPVMSNRVKKVQSTAIPALFQHIVLNELMLDIFLLFKSMSNSTVLNWCYTGVWTKCVWSFRQFFLVKCYWQCVIGVNCILSISKPEQIWPPDVTISFSVMVNFSIISYNLCIVSGHQVWSWCQP